MFLELPPALVTAIWQHAEREFPRECVGVLAGLELGGLELGGVVSAGGAETQTGWLARAAYPLANIAAHPEREYLADPGGLLRALRAMQGAGLTLAAFYHSHPAGPATPSLTDTRLAAYDVPYLIADLHSRSLHAYLLPSGAEVRLVVGDREE